MIGSDGWLRLLHLKLKSCERSRTLVPMAIDRLKETERNGVVVLHLLDQTTNPAHKSASQESPGDS